MADVQKYFEQFHDKIRVDYEKIRGKRDTILKVIRKHLKENDRPGFDELHQGSYAMGVGIAPIEDLEYDIDVGLRFNISRQEHSAEKVHGWVYDAVKDHTKKVEKKGPCVRVTYKDAEEPYHVDLVSYGWEKPEDGDETFKLAHKSKGWLPADPPKLTKFVEDARKPFEDTQDNKTKTDQFRRSVRYLKRWNDKAIPKESDDKPTGLALVLLSAEWLKPVTTVDENPDDLKALRDLASRAAEETGRLVAKKPTPEYEDVLVGLSDDAMKTLKKRFEKLADVLGRAARERDVAKACETLRDEAFGDDFPVPEKEMPRKTAAAAIITSSSSA